MATKSDNAVLPTWLMFTATTRTFSGTPAATDVATVSVKVTASDGNSGSVSDTFDIMVSAAANTPATGAPTITGTPQVGQTLTAVVTAIMDGNGLTGVSYTYQWIRVATDNTETNISMATSSTYTLVTDDQGKTIKVKVSFTDEANNPEMLTSDEYPSSGTINEEGEEVEEGCDRELRRDRVSAAANTPATGAPTITGRRRSGDATAVVTAIMDGNGLTGVSYTYQWIRVATDNTETNISMATSSTYTLVTAIRARRSR